MKRQAATGGVCPVAWTPPPRGLGGTLPGRVSRMRNVVTPFGFRAVVPGGLTVRKADLLGGNRMAQEANAGGRKAAGNRGR